MTKINGKRMNVIKKYAMRINATTNYERSLELLKNPFDHGENMDITIKSKVKKPYIEIFNRFEYISDYYEFEDNPEHFISIYETYRDDEEEQNSNWHEGLISLCNVEHEFWVNNLHYSAQAIEYKGEKYWVNINNRKSNFKYLEKSDTYEMKENLSLDELEGWKVRYYYDPTSDFLEQFKLALSEIILLDNEFKVTLNGKPYKMNETMLLGSYKTKQHDYSGDFSYHFELVDNLEDIDKSFTIPCYWKGPNNNALFKHAKTTLVGVKGWVILDSIEQLSNELRDSPDSDTNGYIIEIADKIKNEKLEEIADLRRMKEISSTIRPTFAYYQSFFKEVLDVNLSYELVQDLELSGKIAYVNKITETIANIIRISDKSLNLKKLFRTFEENNGRYLNNHFIDSKFHNKYLNVSNWSYSENLKHIQSNLKHFKVMEKLEHICSDMVLFMPLKGLKSRIIMLWEYKLIEKESIIVTYVQQKRDQYMINNCISSHFTAKYAFYSLTEYDQLFIGDSFVKANLGENMKDREMMNKEEIERLEKEKDLEEKEISEENEEELDVEKLEKEVLKQNEEIREAIKDSEKVLDDTDKLVEEAKKAIENQEEGEKSDDEEEGESEIELPEDRATTIANLKLKIADLEGKSEESDREEESKERDGGRHLTPEEIIDEGNPEEIEKEQIKSEEEKPTIEQTYEVDTKGNIVQKQSQITQVPKNTGQSGDSEGESQPSQSNNQPPSKGVKGANANDFNDISIDGNGESLTNAQIKEKEKPSIEQIKEKIDDFWKNYKEPTDFYEAGIVVDSKAFGGKGAKINYLFNSKEDKENYELTKSLKSIGIPQKSRLNYRTFEMWKEAVRGCLEVLPRNTQTVPFFYYDINAESRAFISSDMSYVAINIALVDQWEASYGNLKANNLVQYIQQRAIHEASHYFAKKHNDNFIAGEGLVSTAVYVTDLFNRMRKIFNAKNLAKTLEDLKPHVNKSRPKEIPYKVEKVGETKHYCVCPECKHTILMTDNQSETYTRSSEMLKENPIGIIVIGVKCQCGEEF